MATRVISNLQEFTAKHQRDAARGVATALILGASEASVLTPIDTSTLLNSQYRSITQSGNRIVGRVGYTAEYAEVVHDPDRKQRFRRPSAEKEFLKKGFERSEPNLKAIIMGAIKV